MKMTTETWLGLTLMVGGVIMVVALAKQPASTPPKNQHIDSVEEIAQPTVEPLTADIETEMRILAQKHKEREAQVRESERQTEALLKAQEIARNEAIRKAEKQAQEEALVVQTRPESKVLAERQEQERQRREQEQQRKKLEQQKQAEQEKKLNTSGKHVVQQGDNLVRLSRQYGIPVEAIAAANNMSPNDSLHRGRTLKIPAQRDVQELQNQAQAKQQAEAKQQAINQRLDEARREAKKQGVNENYGVQVALAANQQNADELVKKYKSAGYRVSTVQSGRGVRVIIGPERTRDAAILLRDKVASDPSVGASGAWVLQVP